MGQNNLRDDSASPKRPLFPSKLEKDITDQEEALKQQLETLQQKKQSLQ